MSEQKSIFEIAAKLAEFCNEIDNKLQKELQSKDNMQREGEEGELI